MKIICIGRNYVDHIDELKNDIPKNPIIFFKPSICKLEGSDFKIPDFSSDIHHEIEIIYKISKSGKNISISDSINYISGIGLGIAVYIIALFILILGGKSLGRLFSYTGMGSVDKIFGFFFGIFKGYVFVVCIFSIFNWFYSYDKWDMSLNNSYFFPITEKGSKLLIQEYPERKDIENTKKEIENIWNEKNKRRVWYFWNL